MVPWIENADLEGESGGGDDEGGEGETAGKEHHDGVAMIGGWRGSG